MKEEKERIRAFLDHAEIAVEMAKLQVPGGEVRLAVAAYAEDNSGRLTASFACEAFFKDLRILVGRDEDKVD